MKCVAAGIALAGTSVSLFGCGSSSKTSTTTTTRTTTTPTTTTTTHVRSEPRPCSDIVSSLNQQYMGYDENDPSSPNGVTVTFFNPLPNVQSLTSFTDQLYCSVKRDDVGCFQGRADCAMSTAIMNHKVYLNKQVQAPKPYYQSIGVVLNQQKVETELAKCVYAWDGAANNRLNRKCGIGAGSSDCEGDMRHTAFADLCPLQGDGHTCTREDNEVKGQLCSCSEDWCQDGKDSDKYGPITPPASRLEQQCFWEMPALIASDVSTTNHLKDALHHRLLMQTDGCSQPDAGPTDSCQDTELVIDEELLWDAIWKDPATVIDAFVYVEGNQQHAEVMRDNFIQEWAMPNDAGFNKIPVVRMEVDSSFGSVGPFSCPAFAAGDRVAV